MLADGYLSIHTDTAPVSPESRAEPTPLAFGGLDDAQPDPADQAHVIRAFWGGTEDDQYDALTQALQLGIDLPADLLRQAFETGPSERVRLLAFTTYLDGTTSDVESVREALVSGTVNTSAAVQAEARKRLEEFERYQEMIAATPPQGDP